MVGSSIARESDEVLYTWAGPEIAVATTKAYSTQLAVVDLLALYFGQNAGDHDGGASTTTRCRRLLLLPAKMEQILDKTGGYSVLCQPVLQPRLACSYIGRNVDYALGLEGSLKLKEISYIHSEAYASGELKHGTISLIEDGTLVVALGTYGRAV